MTATNIKDPPKPGYYLVSTMEKVAPKENEELQPIGYWNGGSWTINGMPVMYGVVYHWMGPLVPSSKTRLDPAVRVELALNTEAPITEKMLERFQNVKTLRLLHAIMGLCTESGEALDQMKKHLFYGKELDLLNIMEEMGDQDWYLNLLCGVLGCTMEMIENANIAKLAARYGSKFTEHAALIRNLPNELEVLRSIASRRM